MALFWWAVPTLHAQPGGGYVIRNKTVAGGGTTFHTGGGYQLGGTVGQHDAGRLTGGGYRLEGGFWAGRRCQIAAPPIEEQILNPDGTAIVASAKSRFLSFSCGDAGLSQAVRIKFVSLPGAFGIFNATFAWVALPQTASELPGKGFADPVDSEATFLAARLSVLPVYADWSTFGTVHVFDERIIPSHKLPSQPLEPAVYEIQFVSEGCYASLETSFSPALTITNPRWGDVASLGSGEFRAPDDSIDVTADVLAVLAKFSNAPGAPIKARAEMVGTGAGGPQAAITGKIDISDVLAVLGAFSGASYPFPPPAE